MISETLNGCRRSSPHKDVLWFLCSRKNSVLPICEEKKVLGNYNTVLPDSQSRAERQDRPLLLRCRGRETGVSIIAQEGDMSGEQAHKFNDVSHSVERADSGITGCSVKWHYSWRELAVISSAYVQHILSSAPVWTSKAPSYKEQILMFTRSDMFCSLMMTVIPVYNEATGLQTP
jgi:hypothetical protein